MTAPQAAAVPGVDAAPKQKVNPFCELVLTPDGGSRVVPCPSLVKTLTAGARSSAGAHIQTFMRWDAVGGVHHRLVIQPLKRQGGGMVANFCPLCGTHLTDNAASYDEGRADIAANPSLATWATAALGAPTDGE